MATTQRRRDGLASAAAAGMLALGGHASIGAAQTPVAEAPHGQLLQAADGTLYLLVAGRAHPITPAPLTDEALSDGAFWLTPVAALDLARARELGDLPSLDVHPSDGTVRGLWSGSTGRAPSTAHPHGTSPRARRVSSWSPRCLRNGPGLVRWSPHRRARS